jgi:hypothetical protein
MMKQVSPTDRRKSPFTDNLRYKGIDADEGNNLLGVLIIFKITMSAQINELASLGQEPVATAAISLFTTIIHCEKQTNLEVYRCSFGYSYTSGKFRHTCTRHFFPYNVAYTRYNVS